MSRAGEGLEPVLAVERVDNSRPARSHREQVALLAILASAFALRLWQLPARSVWYDEAFSVLLSEKGLLEILRGTAADVQPPLYYFLLHFWNIVGSDPFILRFLSVAFSVASVALVYSLARRAVTHRAAWWGALFTAIAPFQIAYGQELRMYALLQFSLLLYFVGVMSMVQGRGRRQDVIVTVLAGTAALYSATLALFTWVVPDLYLLLRRDAKSLVRLLGAQAASLLLFVPWLLVLRDQVTTVHGGFWTSPPGPAQALQLLLALTTFQPLPDWFLPVALFLTLVLDAVLVLHLILARGKYRPNGFGLVLTACTLPPILLFIFSSLLQPVFVVRAVICSSAAFAILVGWLVGQIDRRAIRLGFGVAAAAVALVSLSFQLGYAEFPRSPFRAADAFLRANAGEGDAIIHDNKLSYLPMHLYDRELHQSWLVDPIGAGSDTLSQITMQVLGISPARMDDSTIGGRRVWFVIFRGALEEARQGGREQPNKAWLDGHLVERSMAAFNDLYVYLYQK